MIRGGGGSAKAGKGEKRALAEDEDERLKFIQSSDEESDEQLEGDDEQSSQS